MNGKKLIGMVVALAVLAAIAVMQKKHGKLGSVSAPAKDATMLEGVDLNAVTALDVTLGSNTVSLVKKGGVWVAGSLYGYPVDFAMFADALRNVAEAYMGKPVRAGNVAESEYGFGETSRKIVLKSGDTVVASIEVGARRAASDVAGSASEFFVRKGGGEAIYLVDYDFGAFPETVEEWIDTELLNVRSSDVVSVKSGGVELKLDGSDWKLGGFDEATEELQTAEANKARMALQYLNCASVADPAMTDAQLGFTNAATYVAQTKDGFTYTVRIGGETNATRYARFAVEYARPAPPAAPEEGADQAAQDAYKQQLETFNTAVEADAKRAADLNAKLSAWTYAIRLGDANDFLVARDNLVKKKEPPTEAETQGAEGD